MKVFYNLIFLYLFIFSTFAFANEVRIKDAASIVGVRNNQLIGYGLVVGLNNTGDSKSFLSTSKAASNLLAHLGMKAESSEITTGNMASVILTATLPPFSKIGDKIDVRVSALGDAKSLKGGTLLMTPLKAGNNVVFAFAQGPLSFASQENNGVYTSALLPSGAFVEKEFIPHLAENNSITLSLKRPDFTNASRMAEKINRHLNGYFAKALNPNSVEVKIPMFYSDNTVEFVSELEGLKVVLDREAVVVFNENTGTVVMGSDVVVQPITVAHGGISLRITDSTSHSQVTDTGDSESKETIEVKHSVVTVGDLVKTLNGMGMKPQDMMSVFQAIHAAGALPADIKTM